MFLLPVSTVSTVFGRESHFVSFADSSKNYNTHEPLSAVNSKRSIGAVGTKHVVMNVKLKNQSAKTTTCSFTVEVTAPGQKTVQHTTSGKTAT